MRTRYCKRIYKPGTATQSIFMDLLKIFLKPPPQFSNVFLDAALALINRQKARLDNIETLQLLPPLIPVEDVKALLNEALRKPFFSMMVLREIAKSNNETTKARLMRLENRRVLMTEDRV